jgi:hypothetical protein
MILRFRVKKEIFRFMIHFYQRRILIHACTTFKEKIPSIVLIFYFICKGENATMKLSQLGQIEPLNGENYTFYGKKKVHLVLALSELNYALQMINPLNTEGEP